MPAVVASIVTLCASIEQTDAGKTLVGIPIEVSAPFLPTALQARLFIRLHSKAATVLHMDVRLEIESPSKDVQRGRIDRLDVGPQATADLEVESFEIHFVEYGRHRLAIKVNGELAGETFVDLLQSPGAVH